MTLPIIQFAAEYFRVDVDKITGSDRHKPVVNARAAIAMVLRYRDEVSLPRIANLMGKSDHTTAINYLRIADDLIETDEAFRRFVDAYVEEPKFSRVRLDLANPQRAERRPPPAPPKAAPPRPASDAPRFNAVELIRLKDGGHQFALDEEGRTRDQWYEQHTAPARSAAFVAALLREKAGGVAP